MYNEKAPDHSGAFWIEDAILNGVTCRLEGLEL